MAKSLCVVILGPGFYYVIKRIFGFLILFEFEWFDWTWMQNLDWNVMNWQPELEGPAARNISCRCKSRAQTESVIPAPRNDQKSLFL